MASYKTNYTAEFYKKDRKISEDTTSDSANPDFTSGEEDSETSGDDIDLEFRKEDRLISQLFREVVDEIMSKNRLRESRVDSAIEEMKQEIHQGHRKGFRRFRGIDFSKPENCCGYLRRYAICHTGLVKQIIWKFFSGKSKNIHRMFTKQNHLKVLSLGGGPGNDLVGFCCALQEIANAVKELDLYIVDASKGWKTVFPTILQKASLSDFGTFSQSVKKMKINTGFMEADLTADGIFDNKVLSSTLEEVDVILMVKLTSFLPDKAAGDLIYNVVSSMKPNAKLIFIDQPYDKEFFHQIKSLKLLYNSYVKYELSFNPAKYRSPSIESTQAHVGIYKKKFCKSDDSSSSEC